MEHGFGLRFDTTVHVP